MAKVQRVNLKVLQGSTYIHDFTLVNESDGGIYDLTSKEVRMQIRALLADTDTIFNIDTSTGDTTDGSSISVNTTTGVITLTITALESDGWDFSQAVYDMEVYEGAVVKRVIKGTVRLDKQVTR